MKSRKFKKDFSYLDKYAKEQEVEAIKLAKDLNLKVIPHKIGESLTFDIEANAYYHFTISVKQLIEYIKNPNIKLGQLSIKLHNYTLKQDTKFEYNYNNNGLCPLEDAKWDYTKIPTVSKGTEVDIIACEYLVGNGGDIMYNQFRKALTKEEATLILDKARSNFLKLLL